VARPEALRWAWRSIASRDASKIRRGGQASGSKRATPCHVCLTSDASLEARRLLCQRITGQCRGSLRDPPSPPFMTRTDRRSGQRHCLTLTRNMPVRGAGQDGTTDLPSPLSHPSSGASQQMPSPERSVARSHRKADFQSAPASDPRPLRKNHPRSRKTHPSIAEKRHDFGATPCSNRPSEPCAEQNHLGDASLEARHLLCQRIDGQCRRSLRDPPSPPCMPRTDRRSGQRHCLTAMRNTPAIAAGRDGTTDLPSPPSHASDPGSLHRGSAQSTS
jgi:hypothetical protein